MKLLETRHPNLRADNRWKDMQDELTDILSLFQDVSYLKKDISITDKAYSFPDVVNECIRKCAVTQTHPNIHMIRRFQPDFPLVRLDSHAFSHAVTNLLKNAMEAILVCPEYRSGTQTGIIKIYASHDETEITLHIIDNGCGIAPEQCRSLSEPFHSTKENGTGLGLMITNRIIRAHKGSLTLQPLQQGTDAKITIPIRP